MIIPMSNLPTTQPMDVSKNTDISLNNKINITSALSCIMSTYVNVSDGHLIRRQSKNDRLSYFDICFRRL